MTLTLVDVKQVKDEQPAAFHELAAAKYLGMRRSSFRELVMSGIIPYTYHLNGKTRIYLRSDLDAYLDSLEKCRMVPRENSRVALKGVAK